MGIYDLNRLGTRIVVNPIFVCSPPTLTQLGCGSLAFSFECQRIYGIQNDASGVGLIGLHRALRLHDGIGVPVRRFKHQGHARTVVGHSGQTGTGPQTAHMVFAVHHTGTTPCSRWRRVATATANASRVAGSASHSGQSSPASSRNSATGIPWTVSLSAARIAALFAARAFRNSGVRRPGGA